MQKLISNFTRRVKISLVRSYNPIWSMVDLIGKQLDDTYYFFTLQNTLPYLPSPIWQDASGLVSWSVPIQVLANGTLPENMYFDDTQVYRLEWRAGPTQQDALIYEVNNYIPGDGVQPTPSTAFGITDNQITNPQFSSVDFANPLTTGLVITAAGSVDIAPGWSVVTTGAGTLTVTQVEYAGNVYTATNSSNASTGISLANNGFSTVTLKQRFDGNGALWTGQAVSGAMTARALNAVTLSMDIRYSNVGSSNTNIMSKLLTTANTDYVETASIPSSTSALLPDSAWTDIDLSFAGNTTVFITSVQVIGESTELAIKYLQTTPERQEDEQFHIFNVPLQYKPIPSLLVGWDFPLNPAQLGSSGTITTTPAYILDQTIAVCSAGINVPYDFSAITYGYDYSPTGNNAAFYLMQYLSGAEAKKILGTPLSVNINAYTTSVAVGTVVRVYLLRGSSAAVIPTLPSVLGTIAGSGVFTRTQADWTIINQVNKDQTSGTLNEVLVNSGINDIENDIGLFGWEITDSSQIGDTDKFAIIVTFGFADAGTVVTCNSISLVPGNIPTRPAPQTSDEVLMECRRYLQTSFLQGTVPAPNTGVNSGASFSVQNSAGPSAALGPMIRFNPPLINTPLQPQLYNPAVAASSNIYNSSIGATWTACNTSSFTANGFNTFGVTPGGSSAGDAAQVHWLADARLGKV